MPGFLAAVPLSFPPEAKSQGFITDVVAVVADSFPNALRAAKATNVSWNTDPKYLLSTDDLFENAEKQMLNEDGSDFYKIGEFDRVNSKIELESTYELDLLRIHQWSQPVHYAIILMVNCMYMLEYKVVRFFRSFYHNLLAYRLTKSSFTHI